jgi:L-lactate utilization protein LutC
MVEFARNFEQLAGKCYFANGPFEAGEVAKKILQGVPKERIVRAKLIPSIEAFVSKDVPSLSLVEMPRWVDAVTKIERAIAGVTMADYGISSTGSLVEICYDDSSKLVSSLTKIHVAFLRAENILKNLDDLAPIVRKLLTNSPHNNIKPVISLISGPSRTGDIEMKLVLGAHGPHQVHAIIVKS